MSVINQVLNQLEQRGAQGELEQVQVRAVPQPKSRPALPWLGAGLLLLLAFAAWQRLPLRQQNVTAPVSAQAMALTPPAASAVPVVTPPPEAPVTAEMAAPALHLSFELSSIPLPAVPHTGLAQATDQPEHNAHRVDQAVAPKQDNSAAVSRQHVQATVPAKTSGAALPVKQVSPVQLADAEFAKATAYMQQGRVNEALAGYEATLRQHAGHDAARQALVALLLDAKRGADAERVLQEGLSRRPEHTGFAMLLARLQVERGALEPATATLEKSLPYADAQADFQAFFAALLQRQKRHKEAINHYQLALQLAPGNGVWLMGFGISLQAVQRSVDARDAYQRALDSNTLSPNLQAFVQQKLKGL